MEMSTDTNGRQKRVKKRKVDKEFSYEESDGKSSAYIDGDQEITEKNKNTTEKNTQNKKNCQKNKENQIPKQKNTSKKNKKESQDKANSFIGAECLAQMKNQLASPAPVTLMQHPNFGTVAPQKSLSAPTTTFYHLQTTSNNLLLEKHVNVSQAPPSYQVTSTVKSLPPLSVNSHPLQTPPQHLQDNTLPSSAIALTASKESTTESQGLLGQNQAQSSGKIAQAHTQRNLNPTFTQVQVQNYQAPSPIQSAAAPFEIDPTHLQNLPNQRQSSQVQVQQNFHPVSSQTFQQNFVQTPTQSSNPTQTSNIVQTSTQSQNPAQTSNIPPYQPTFVELVNAAAASSAQILLSETEHAFDCHTPGSAGAGDETSTWANFNNGNSLHTLTSSPMQAALNAIQQLGASPNNSVNSNNTIQLDSSLDNSHMHSDNITTEEESYADRSNKNDKVNSNDSADSPCNNCNCCQFYRRNKEYGSEFPQGMNKFKRAFL